MKLTALILAASTALSVVFANPITNDNPNDAVISNITPAPDSANDITVSKISTRQDPDVCKPCWDFMDECMNRWWCYLNPCGPACEHAVCKAVGKQCRKACGYKCL